MRFSVLLLLCGCLLLETGGAIAAPKKNKQKPSPTVGQDSTTQSPPAGKKDHKEESSIEKLQKAYDKILKDSTTVKRTGLFTVYERQKKFYLALTDSSFNRDFLVVSRIAQAGTGMRGHFSYIGYGGDLIHSLVIQLRRAPGEKVYFHQMYYNETGGNPKEDMYTSVRNSNLAPVVSVLNYAGISKDTGTILVDVTDLFAKDNPTFFFSQNEKKSYKLAGFHADKSHIKSVRVYPLNLEVRSFKTYSTTTEMSAEEQRIVSMEISTSVILLPEKPMIPRLADDRVGFFTRKVLDFATDPQRAQLVKFITRWRLEPKDSTAYFAGKLVEPRKPIIFYIDPATPPKWVPYLIRGVEWWQKAFETAGFKNAIFARRAPTPQEDSTWSLEDARYSAIVYKSSTVTNASGPHIHDPRSGEILESHINWYHNMQVILHDWYMIQCGQSDPAARKMTFPDTLMGKLIEYVAAHEVGHTLGLRHNWGASYSVPVAMLRNRAFVRENGVTPSIMDYSRFNYVAQPSDSFSQDENIPRKVGAYDKWAIEWGYRLYKRHLQNAEEERDTLNRAVIAKNQDQRFWFGREGHPTDPRSQHEDLSNDAVKASKYGIKNLRWIITRLPEWSAEPNKGYSSLSRMYNSLVRQYRNYVRHVMKNIGGLEETPKTVEQAGDIFVPTAFDKQQKALQFLNEEVFTSPTWLVPASITSRLGLTVNEQIFSLQKFVIQSLLNANTLSVLEKTNTAFGNRTKVYSLDVFFPALMQMVFANTRMDLYRKSLQNLFVDELIRYVQPAPAATMISANVNALLRELLKKIKAICSARIRAKPLDKNRYHYEGIVDKINELFRKK